ncbi:hypothetical protein CkaCkLH20_01998 [Colletotrichum karsti]|uniref:Uncharacterized protein n=1 Tax=Colletotrichum karsti TaxID=1095194 RepID=A0A9P6IHJ4_9PEZI|nr:uncharacterized protein CkaCkLH20_01998 [Colletotrichum karsti]KAF9880956.1 hypothetical protein CkaCkLH20_01998 [Colletotrichum karsti]
MIKCGKSPDTFKKAYEIIELLDQDIVSIHNGFGFDLTRITAHVSFPNGTTIVDSIYNIDKYLKSGWSSISSASMLNDLDLPRKLNVDYMVVKLNKKYDVSKMLVCNIRDLNLHALVVEYISSCDRLFALAGISRSTFWDTIADNLGQIVFCYIASVSISINMGLDMSTVFSSVVIGGNSLHGSIIPMLMVYIDCCVSSRSIKFLCEKALIDRSKFPDAIETNNVVDSGEKVLMKDSTEYMYIIKGKSTLLNTA